MTQPERYRFDVEGRTARLVGNRSLRPKNLAVLRELVGLRDTLAREQDVPPRTLLMDEVLVRLAKNPAGKPEQLGTIKGMPWPIVDKYGEQLLAAVRRGVEMPREERPRLVSIEETPVQRVRVDAVWSLASAYCLARGVDPRLVTSRREIARLICEKRRRADDPLSFERGWRRELLGDLLERLLAEDAQLAFTWRDGGLVAAW